MQASVGRDALIPPWRNLYRLWQALQMICRIRCSHRAVAAHQTIPANSARLLRADDKHLPLQTKSRYCPTIIYSYIHPVLLRTNLPGVYLKNRNYRLFLQTQPDFALKSLGIPKDSKALCLTSCLCLRNIRHFLCFQIHFNQTSIFTLYIPTAKDVV